MTARHELLPVVSTLLPSASHARLLRGCCDPEAAGGDALKRWLRECPDATSELTRPQNRWLLPLVRNAFVHHDVDPGALATLLRTATFREELRTESFQAILGRILQALASVAVHPIVLKGAALGEAVYPHPSHRHAHDVELLVHRDEWARAEPVLADAGFSGVAAVDGPRRHLQHASGLPLVLHRHLFRIPFHNALPDDDVWTRSRPVTLAGCPALVLAPADALVQLAGEGLHGPGVLSYRWLVDAAFLLRSHEVAWDVFESVAAGRHLALATSVMLDAIAGDLGAPVPSEVRARIGAMAACDRSIGVELALHAACAAAGGLLPLCRRTSSRSARFAALRWQLTPSVAFLGWSTQPSSPVLRAAHARAFSLLQRCRRWPRERWRTGASRATSTRSGRPGA